MTRKDLCMVCAELCGDDGPTCGNCGRSICINCMTEEEKTIFFTNYIKFIKCEKEKYPNCFDYSYSDSNPNMICLSDFIFSEMESFKQVYNSFTDFHDTANYEEDDLFTCRDCIEEDNRAAKTSSYIQYLEQKLTDNGIF